MHVVLTVVAGPRTGVRARLPEKAAITIGRSKVTDFHILDSTMSRVHAVIARDADGWYVEDQKSRNGTWVGEERVARARLRSGDVIVLGKTSGIRFEVETDEGSSSASYAAPACTQCGKEIPHIADLVRNPDGRPYHLACRNLDYLIGTDLGEFRVAERAPRLGDAFCFRAHQPSLNRMVLLEVYDPPLTALPGFRAALLDEVRRASRYLHPAILQIYAFEESRGMCCVVMEHFRAERLAQVLEQRRFVKIRGAVRVAEQLLEAMKYALEQGAPLPWLTPDRVLVSEEHEARVKLFETPRGGSRRVPRPSEAPYVPPETAEEGSGAKGHEARLVYSVGAILYHTLAGIPPFEGASVQEIARRAQAETAPALRRINLKVSPALARVVERAIDAEPSARHATLDEFLASLRAAS